MTATLHTSSPRRLRTPTIAHMGDDGGLRNVNIPVRVTREFSDWVKATAAAEMRTHAQMLRVLLAEARRNRETAPTVVRRGITPHGLVDPGQYWPGGEAPVRGDLP
jgi:hypothetical protein